MKVMCFNSFKLNFVDKERRVARRFSFPNVCAFTSCFKSQQTITSYTRNLRVDLMTFSCV